MTCTLADFKLPEPDVRLVTMANTVYKVKLRCRNENGAEKNSNEFWKQDKVQYDIERVIRRVLQNEDNIDPIRTDDFVVYPYKKEWVNAQKLEFSKYNQKLRTSPYLFLFYIERLSIDKIDFRLSDEEQNVDQFLNISSDEKQGQDDWGSGMDDNSFDDERKTKDDGGGYMMSFFNLILTPMKKLGKIWR